MSQRIANISITTDEYEELGRAGLLDPDRRLELLEGEVYEMSPTGTHHAACVKRLAAHLHRVNGKSFIVSTQDPIRLSDVSEPLPAIVLVRWRDDYYEDAHPKANEVLLLIEVADTTLLSDRTFKFGLYAAAGISEAWLINLPGEKVEVFTQPARGAYTKVEEFLRGTVVRSSNVEALSIPVNDIFG